MDIEHLFPGDFFEDCRYHPCLCVIGNELNGDEMVSGISLIDGSEVYCSARNCGIVRLNFYEAMLKRAALMNKGIPDAAQS